MASLPDWLPTVAIIVIVLIVLGFKIRRKLRLKQNLRRTAETLGLAYYDSADELPTKLSEHRTELPGSIANPENVAGFQKFLTLMSKWHIDGKYNGVQVKIHPYVSGTGKNRSVYTRVIVFFSSPMQLGMKISNEGLLSRIGKSISLVDDVQTGNDEMDRTVLIQAKNQSRVRDLLSSPNVQHAILEAYKYESRVVVDDDGARLDTLESSAPLTVDHFRQTLDVLSRIITSVEGHMRFHRE